MWLRTYLLSEMLVAWWMNLSLNGNHSPRRSYCLLGFQSFALEPVPRMAATAGIQNGEERSTCSAESNQEESWAGGYGGCRSGVQARTCCGQTWSITPWKQGGMEGHPHWGDLIGGSCPLGSLRGHLEGQWEEEGQRPQKDYRGSLFLQVFLV